VIIFIGQESFDSEGYKFYFGFFGNYQPYPFFEVDKIRLYVSPVVNLSVPFNLVAVGKESSHTAPTEVALSADEVSIVNDDTRERSVVIESSNGSALSVVAFAEEFTSSDTFKVLPCVRLPVEYYEYYAVSVPFARTPLPDYETDYENDEEFEAPLGNSAIVLVTTEEETKLTINLTQNFTVTADDIKDQIPEATFIAGTPVTITIPKAAQTLYISTVDDLTGSRVTSSKPIAFISGHECGTIPDGLKFCDHMLEQIPPTASWGKTFVTCPIAERSAYDLFKIIASDEDSTVSVTCTGSRPAQTLYLQKGEFTTLNVSSSSHCYVSSNRPVLLVQFSVVSSVENSLNGDPFMVVVPPIEQYRSSYLVNTFSSSLVFFGHTNFINVLLPAGVSPDGLRLNGQPLGDAVSFVSVPCVAGDGSCGSSAQVSIGDGVHTLTHENSSAVFNAIVYWLSYRTGSGYFAGMTQKPIACTCPNL